MRAKFGPGFNLDIFWPDSDLNFHQFYTGETPLPVNDLYPGPDSDLNDPGINLE